MLAKLCGLSQSVCHHVIFEMACLHYEEKKKSI